MSTEAGKPRQGDSYVLKVYLLRLWAQEIKLATRMETNVWINTQKSNFTQLPMECQDNFSISL